MRGVLMCIACTNFCVGPVGDHLTLTGGGGGRSFYPPTAVLTDEFVQP